MKQKIIIVILIVLMLINTVLSVYIEIEKHRSEDNSDTTIPTNCFLNGTGSCYLVQTSAYAKSFGISNTILGMVVFPIIAILLLIAGFAQEEKKNVALGLLSILFFAAIGFSLWFLYVQTFILKMFCTFCVWIDIITLLSAIVFLVGFWKSLPEALRSLKITVVD